MGWSCTEAAGKTLDAWEKVCRASTGSSNTWTAPDRRQYFYEVSAIEYNDGAITGTVHSVSPCRLTGQFRIEPNGASAGISRMPGSRVIVKEAA